MMPHLWPRPAAVVTPPVELGLRRVGVVDAHLTAWSAPYQLVTTTPIAKGSLMSTAVQRRCPPVPHILVMAKAPVAGRVKTRLCPPYTYAEAAALAEAALSDTLEAVLACGAGRRVLALDGAPGPWLPSGFEVVAQCRGSLNRRLAHAWATAGGPGVQIGMDTPQVTAADLDFALGALDTSDAALGHAADGGWWAIGLRHPDPAVFHGLPMSTARTGRAQEARLRRLGLDVALLPTLVDLDTADALGDVVAAGPGTRTARLAHELGVGTPLGRVA